MDTKFTPELLGILLSCPCSESPKSPESSEGSIGTYVIRKSYKEEFYEDGKLVKEVFQYGEVFNSVIVDIFGHLMYFDDLKNLAKYPDETTYLVAKYEWDEKECYFTVFKNTNSTDHYGNDVFFFERKFERNSMGMEPFITLSNLECELEAAESETSSSALSSQPESPKAETVSPKEEPPKKASVSPKAETVSPKEEPPKKASVSPKEELPKTADTPKSPVPNTKNHVRLTHTTDFNVPDDLDLNDETQVLQWNVKDCNKLLYIKKADGTELFIDPRDEGDVEVTFEVEGVDF